MPRKRRRGEGTWFLSKAETARAGRPVYIARISLGTVAGKRVQHKARASTEDGARAALAKLRGLYAAGPDTATMTLDAYLTTWLEGVRPTVRASTYLAYSKRSRHIAGLLGGIPVVRLSPDDVRRLIRDRLRAGLAPGTVAGILRTLITALEALRRERRIPDNPARLVRGPRIDREPVRPMTPAEAQQVLAAVRGHHLEALYVLLLGSGMRVGEAASLDWRDVDLEAGVVSIRRGKTARSLRVVPVSAFVVTALREHRTRTRRYGLAEPVFLGERTHSRVNPQSVSGVFTRLLRTAGLRHLRVHDLRHANATLMLATGTSMRVIADQLGHADPAITARIYAHVVPGAQKAAMDRLDEALREERG